MSAHSGSLDMQTIFRHANHRLDHSPKKDASFSLTNRTSEEASPRLKGRDSEIFEGVGCMQMETHRDKAFLPFHRSGSLARSGVPFKSQQWRTKGIICWAVYEPILRARNQCPRHPYSEKLRGFPKMKSSPRASLSLFNIQDPFLSRFSVHFFCLCKKPEKGSSPLWSVDRFPSVHQERIRQSCQGSTVI